MMQNLHTQIKQELHARDIAKTNFDQQYRKIRNIVATALIRFLISSLCVMLIAMFMSGFDMIRSLVYEAIWMVSAIVSLVLIVKGNRYMSLFVGVRAWRKYRHVVINNDYATDVDIEELYATYRNHVIRLREMRKTLRRVKKEYALYKRNMLARMHKYLTDHGVDDELKEYMLTFTRP